MLKSQFSDSRRGENPRYTFATVESWKFHKSSSSAVKFLKAFSSPAWLGSVRRRCEKSPTFFTFIRGVQWCTHFSRSFPTSDSPLNYNLLGYSSCTHRVASNQKNYYAKSQAYAHVRFFCPEIRLRRMEWWEKRPEPRHVDQTGFTIALRSVRIDYRV